MKRKITFKYFLYALLFFFSSQKILSQCFEIESILVAACISSPGTEGYNEMVRFRVGAAPINTVTLSVNWPAQSWQGLIQNGTTAGKVASINADIALAGGCGQLIEPLAGVLPANAEVVLVTSENFSATANVFGAITQNIYIIFQNNAAVTAGHFGNFSATPGLRTLSMSFGACSDSVTYERSLLASSPGATANFTPAGVPSYSNPGCVAPVETFSVDAGTTPVTACPGQTITLSGTAVGSTSVAWTATSGSFSAAGSLATNFTLSASASGSIILTLTATNACGNNITDTVRVNVNTAVTPTFSQPPAICSGAALSPLPTTSTNGIIGSWSPALNNTVTTQYTFTPTSGQCAAAFILTIIVNQGVLPTFTGINLSVCQGDVLPPLPTTSTIGITGSWSPALNNTATTPYTFTPTSGQCATTAMVTIMVNPVVTPTFNAVAPICSGETLAPLPTTSTNGIIGSWSPALNNTLTTQYTFTPTSGQCATAFILTIIVNPVVTPTFNAVAPICSGETLAPLPTTSINGIAGSWSPALNNTVTTQYTFTPNSGQCATTKFLTIVVNQGVSPTFTGINQLVCPGDPLPPLPAVSTNGITGTWSPPLNSVVTTLYTFTPDPNQCAVSASLGITVNDGIIPIFDALTIPVFICYGATLSPLPTTSMNGIIGSWSPVLSNTQTDTYTFTPNPGQCAQINRLTINVVNPVTKNETYFICVDSAGNAITTAPINSGLSPLQYSFAWSFNGGPISNNSNSITASVPGTYTLEATNLTTGCVTFTLVSEVKGVLPATAAITANADFAEEHQIIVAITGGLGSYEYQLNGGAYQTGNIFNVYDGGEYTVHVKDNLGCNEFDLRITILDYPKFFTPNGDGYNDVWKIQGLLPKNKPELYIFDRYGKLLQQVFPYDFGWDGASNGHEMPSTDYWFKLLYLDKNGISKEFKSHFALKR